MTNSRGMHAYLILVSSLAVASLVQKAGEGKKSNFVLVFYFRRLLISVLAKAIIKIIICFHLDLNSKQVSSNYPGVFCPHFFLIHLCSNAHSSMCCAKAREI